MKEDNNQPVKCAITGRWFHPEDPNLKRHGMGKQFAHKEASKTNARNSNKIKKFREAESVCCITGMPFSQVEGAQKPHGDHCHKTGLYRGACWAVANRTMGGIEYLMDKAGMSLEEVLDAFREHLSKEGVDIGLETFPVVGAATPEEVGMVQCDHDCNQFSLELDFDPPP